MAVALRVCPADGGKHVATVAFMAGDRVRYAGCSKCGFMFLVDVQEVPVQCRGETRAGKRCKLDEQIDGVCLAHYQQLKAGTLVTFDKSEIRAAMV